MVKHSTVGQRKRGERNRGLLYRNNVDDVYIEHEYVQFGDVVSLDNDLQAQVDDSRKQIHKYMIL